MPLGYQSRPGWCGPAALQTALAVHGVRWGQARIAGLLGATDDGTDEVQMLDLLGRMGASVSELETNSKQEARAWLMQMAPTAPVLLCVDDWDHWVCVAGQCGPRLWLLDSTNEAWNKAGLGRWALLPKTVLRRWRAARRLREEGGRYYGISLLALPPVQQIQVV